MVVKEEIYPGRFFRIPYEGGFIESTVYDLDKKVYFKIDENIFDVKLKDIQSIPLDEWWKEHLPEMDPFIKDFSEKVHLAQMMYLV